MRSIVLVSILLGVASVVPGRAQSAPQATPPPLGPGPLLARAPAFAQWLESVKGGPMAPGEVTSAQTKYTQRTLVRKTGDIRNEITAYADGHKSEVWIADGVQAEITPGQVPVFAMAGANARARAVMEDYSKSDFRGFEWISRKNYTGVQMMAGIPCIVFHEDDAPPDSDGAPASTGTSANLNAQTGGGMTAYIAADSRLPILLQTDDGATVYQWEQPPQAPLQVPESMLNFINMQQERKQQAAAPPAAP